MPIAPKLPDEVSGLDAFALHEEDEEDKNLRVDVRDADSFFNLPGDVGSGEEQP
jgi:hypothetical protein